MSYVFLVAQPRSASRQAFMRARPTRCVRLLRRHRHSCAAVAMQVPGVPGFPRPPRAPRMAAPAATYAHCLPQCPAGLPGCRACALLQRRRGRPPTCSWLPRAARLPVPAEVEFQYRWWQVRPAALHVNALRCGGAADSVIRRAVLHARVRLSLAEATRILPHAPRKVWDLVAAFALDGSVLCRARGKPVFEPWGTERLDGWFWRGAASTELQVSARRGVWSALSQ